MAGSKTPTGAIGLPQSSQGLIQSGLNGNTSAQYNFAGDPINAAATAAYKATPGINGNQVVQQNQNNINTAQTQYNDVTSQNQALLKSIQSMMQANAPGVAPTLDLNAINAQAQKNAQNTVNPLYTQYLNEYLQQEAANQTAAQKQNELNLQQEQAGLGNTLAQNTLAQQAVGRTNELTQGNINAQQQNYELQSGNAQNAKLQAIQSNIGSGNLTGSGIGQQQVYEAENARNVADAQQRGQLQYQRDVNNLSTQDTFAQLAQSSQYAQTAEGQQEAQTNFNLNDYLRQAAYNDSQYKQNLSGWQQQATTAQTQQQQASMIQQQLSALNPTGSKNYAAGEQAYGNLLNPSLGLPEVTNQANYLQAAGAAV